MSFFASISHKCRQPRAPPRPCGHMRAFSGGARSRFWSGPPPGPSAGRLHARMPSLHGLGLAGAPVPPPWRDGILARRRPADGPSGSPDTNCDRAPPEKARGGRLADLSSQWARLALQREDHVILAAFSCRFFISSRL